MTLCRFWGKMATNAAVLKGLERNGAEADQIIEYLKQQVALLKERVILQATLREEKKLRVEDAKLKKEVEELKQELIQAEIHNGIKQVPAQSSSSLETNCAVSESVIQSASITTTTSSGTKEQMKGGGGEEKKVKEKTEKKEKREKHQQSVAASADSKPDDLRFASVFTAKKRPDADSLYVGEVDVGEAAPGTVVSGLVSHVPVEQMQSRMVVLLCNLKPAKMRGVLSQAMVMCASSPEKVEILAPPNGSVPGEPDKELNPKKKIWGQIQPDLHTNNECVATYKGAPFEVKGKGVCRAQTMANSGIK